MDAENRYVTLVTSLPALPVSPFAARQTPISRIQLDRRLTLLSAEDARRLALIESTLQWNRMPSDVDTAALVERAQRIMEELDNDFLRDLIQWRLELRTNISALRHRHSGRPLPAEDPLWGCGRWQRVIRRHWHEPGMGLERVFPWVPEADRLLQEENPSGLERLLLSLVWEHARRIGAGHYFDFEAVVLYVVRWYVIERWSRYDGEKALERFDRMLAAALQ